MTPDTLARLQAALHHLVPQSLFLFFWHLWWWGFLADLVEFTVVDGHGALFAARGSLRAARFESDFGASMLIH